ncbi:MAG: pcm protein-L-isoaspartate(D-aspartate) O-methyltransferase [Bacteroidetes bacterium]|nr:pcm protein-L-isoaspartate(D-aspartate) O-methyltransferase [Bacteroidota bacterium]
MLSEAEQRNRMVTEQIEARGIKDKPLLAVLRKIPRHLFIPESLQEYAYMDEALPAYCGQTISQPYIVARMTELLQLTPLHKVLEIGTGTGYQTAVLAELAGEVYTVEINPGLVDIARSNPLMKAYSNIHFITGNGYNGYPPAALYDAVIVTAAPPHLPEELVNQLSPGGRMVIPVGSYDQELELIIKNSDNSIKIHPIFGVRFVPMTDRF